VAGVDVLERKVKKLTLPGHLRLKRGIAIPISRGFCLSGWEDEQKQQLQQQQKKTTATAKANAGVLRFAQNDKRLGWWLTLNVLRMLAQFFGRLLSASGACLVLGALA
jgi:hypothetical protein